MNFKIKFCFFFFCFVALGVAAQKYPFVNYTPENGLSSSQVLCIHQDAVDHSLWLGTNNGGVNVFDGKSFEVYSKQNGLPDNTVFDIKEYDGKKYFGTNNGLSVFDGKKFKTYTDKDGLKHNRIYVTYKDTKGRFWVATHGGMNMFKEKVLPFTGDSVLANKPVFSIYEDSKGNIWFCTLFNGLIKYDGVKFQHYLFTDKAEDVNNFVSSVIEISPDKYWVLSRTGLFELGAGKKAIDLKMPNIRMFHLFKDSRKNIWISSDAGAIKFAENKFTYYTMDNGLVDNVVWRTMEDNEHNLWFISNQNGFSKLNTQSFENYSVDQGLPSSTIYVVDEFENGVKWLGTDSGVVKFKDGKCIGEINFDLNKDLRIHNEVYDFGKLNEAIYVATNFGVARIKDNKTKEFLPKGEVRSLAKCWSVFPENENNIWLGTQGGICKIDHDSIAYWNIAGNISDHVFDIKKGKNGNIYFSTEKGLLIYDRKKLNSYGKKNGFTSQRVRCTAEDKNGKIWIATNEGVFTFFNGEFTKIKIPSVKVDAIFSIAVDSKNNVWAGLANGIIKIPADTTKEKIVFLSAEDGFLGKECNNNSLFIDKEDVLWIGTKNGLTVFQPHLYFHEMIIPSLQIIDLRLFHNKVDWTQFTDSISPNGLPYNLELSFQQNHVTFLFKAISLKKPDKVSYRYQLVGYDNTWFVTNEPSAVYSSLDPGYYVFQLQVSTDGENWSTPAVEYSFLITPPFWRTWWFYSLCALIIFTWIYSYVRIQKANSKLREQRKTIIEQKSIVLEKNKAILDSIQYAKRIQRAILPKRKFMESELKNYFVSYLPKDIVSGDFYWVEKVNNKTYFAVADCTGHGVPGAMVSIMCKNLLTQVVKEMSVTKPAHILDLITSLLVTRIFDTDGDSVKDGMDITLCCIDYNTLMLEYSGANNPLYIYRNGEIIIYKADKQPVGKFDFLLPFTHHVIQLQKDDIIYAFSDGYADQFGGDDDKKFKTKNLRELLIKIADRDLEIQKRILEDTFHKWKGLKEQVDDICILGIKI